MPFSRLRCHFCGSKSPHDKSVREFECSICDATNFFDGKGNIIDTPADMAARPRSISPETTASFSTFTQPLPETLSHQEKPVFCRTCIQNQLLYNQALANYLPEEHHSRYREYEAALPKYTAELEKRYPQVCKRCAPLAQAKINRADYYGMTQNAAKAAAAHRARRGQPAVGGRDDWGKWAMRLFLNTVGLVSYLGLLVQVSYHIYGGLGIFFTDMTANMVGSEFAFNPTPKDCVQQMFLLRFDTSCYVLLGDIVPSTLILAVGLLWYNPGLKFWYHHTWRVEAVQGKREYFLMQLIILVFRYAGWRYLSNHAITVKLDREQLLAFHGFAVVFPCLTQYVASRIVKPVKWTIKGKMMPRPDDVDVLGISAGPEPENHTPKASEGDPWKYLRKQKGIGFDINHLAPKPSKTPTKPLYANGVFRPLSPADSDEGEDADSMETDFQPVMRSSIPSNSHSQPTRLQPTRSLHNHSDTQPLGWSSMREQVFGIEEQMRSNQHHQQQQRTIEQQLPSHNQPMHNNPFYTRVPPAPMSIERRLRNPLTRPVQPVEAPLSQQKDFFTQMRRGVKPVAFPEKGSDFQLRNSEWVLPGDVRETGLEDLMSGNNFSIADEPSLSPVKKTVGWVSGILGLN